MPEIQLFTDKLVGGLITFALWTLVPLIVTMFGIVILFPRINKQLATLISFSVAFLFFFIRFGS
ncbi:hypothetical protein EDM57_12060 [Brevibacillus gelatini]|uniref:Uncharacterized protein n=1 Tax=Brevibacillus gelatini TaxID=1655277 RepID=A0A3M8B115_9BACL|nr:hypothetical protein EDM57_12060 [Brevibacillus gelatini]